MEPRRPVPYGGSMRDYVNEHFSKYYKKRVKPTIYTKNGKRISVQGSAGHYCTPKVDMANPEDTYSHVEVWCWPKNTRVFNKWTKHPSEPAGWVPVEVVNKWIHRNGGFLDEA